MRSSWAALLVLAFPVHAFEPCDTPGMAQKSRLEQAPWESAFREKKFHEVDAHFNAYLDALDAGKISDAQAKAAFEVFESSQPGREPLHTEWLWARPESRAARLAIGYHLMRRWIDAGDERDLKAALRAFELAAEKTRKPTLSMAARIRMASARAGVSRIDPMAIYEEAVRAFPDTIEVRVQAIHASNPKRGGSLAQIDGILADARGLPASDRRYIEYIAYQEMAAAMQDARRDKDAADLYDKSSALCPGLDGSLARALVAYKRLNRADALLGRAAVYVQRRPRDGWGYAMRGWAERSLGLHAEAFADFDRAVQMGEGSALQELAWYFETGTEVPRDRRKALELYSIAADRGIDGGAENAKRLRLLLGATR